MCAARAPTASCIVATTGVGRRPTRDLVGASSRASRVRTTTAASAAVLTQLQDAELPHLHSAHLPINLFETTVDVAGRAVTLVLPEDEETIVNVYSALGRPDDDPHWADLWQGSVALAEEVLSNPSLVAGKRVVDLGTGLGLAGIAAGLAGAKEVVLTDREPRALYCALCAAAANGLAVAPLSKEVAAPDEDGISLPPLIKFAEPEKASGSVSAALLDWFEPDMTPFGGVGFDVVLACDVLYTPEAVDVIAPLVMRLFGGASATGEATVGDAGGRFILADPPGRFPLNHTRFLSLMEDPSLVEGDRPGGGGVSRIVQVDSRFRDCVNLEGNAMTVELTSYDIGACASS